jgi:hypothetical protein
MMRLVKKLCTWKIVPITWTALTIFLLCIPGTAIPSEGVFATDGIDKVVHVILFGGIVLLWGFNLYFRRSDNQKWRKIIVKYWRAQKTVSNGYALYRVDFMLTK